MHLTQKPLHPSGFFNSHLNFNDHLNPKPSSLSYTQLISLVLTHFKNWFIVIRIKPHHTYKDACVKTITEWLDEYSESHQNKTNKSIHWVCVPAILFSIIGMLAHFSALITALLLVLTLVFYTRLDLVLAVAMSALLLVMAWLIWILPVGVGFYIGLFIVAWIGQFYGHKVEGKKPSFFKDLQFLLIGPLWCVDAFLGKVAPKFRKRQNNAISAQS